jgi:hypothetical protein
MGEHIKEGVRAEITNMYASWGCSRCNNNDASTYHAYIIAPHTI